MKKVLMKFNFTLLIAIILTSFFGITLKADNNNLYDSDFATYKEGEAIDQKDLGYGVEYLKTTALSTAKRGNSIATDSPEVVNMVAVPSATYVRVVNYTYPNKTGWAKQKLSVMVRSFEEENPGWIVLAGVNGDFYDWHSLDLVLPTHTTGSAVSDGNVLRTVNSKSVGWTNNGTENSFLYTDRLTFTDYYILTIYDNNNDVIETFKVDKVNEAPVDNELAVYYNYKVLASADTTTEVKVSVPANDSYIVRTPIRCLPTENSLYAKGEISAVNTECELVFGSFAIVTKNPEITSHLAEGVTIRVQKDVTGAMAECDQIMAVGSTLIENGIISEDNSDGMRLDRHPRTCLGVKEDGTLMFFTVDGRQQASGMYGMNQDELASMMKYYGCYQAFNVDGGGSTTFGIRDENGEFVIVNSPSDGDERLVSNVMLVAVPELQLQLSDYTDQSVKFSYGDISHGIAIDNLKITINGVTKEMQSNEFVFDGLTPKTVCKYSYSYDISYKGQTYHKTSTEKEFTTGCIPTKIENEQYDIIDDMLIVKFTLTDVDNLMSNASVNCGGHMEWVYDVGPQEIVTYIDTINQISVRINIAYEIGSVPNRTERIAKDVKWYPSNLVLDNFTQDEQVRIREIIDNVNENISTLAKDDQIALISDAHQKIELINYVSVKKAELKNYVDNQNSSNFSDQVKDLLNEKLASFDSATTKDEMDDLFDTAKSDIDAEIANYYASLVQKLTALKTAKKYSQKNLAIINDIIAKAQNDMEDALTVKDAETIYNNAQAQIEQVKTKGCKSGAIALTLCFISCSVAIAFIFKKRH